LAELLMKRHISSAKSTLLNQLNQLNQIDKEYN
jgi:hypothetical protein